MLFRRNMSDALRLKKAQREDAKIAHSKVNMPRELKSKCHKAIHTASAAALAAGAIPIPMSDAIPITAAQVVMVVALGKAFGLTLSESVAKSLVGVSLTQGAGRAIFTNILKCIPGAGTVAGAVIGAATAASLTEALGWIIADDFYRVSIGQDPQDLIQNASELKGAFSGLRFGKR